jgi:hypothetical protein
VRSFTTAHAIALVALVLSVGGTSYAATRLAAGSVGTTQLRDGAVTSQKVRNGSLVAADFRASELAGGLFTTTSGGRPHPADTAPGVAILTLALPAGTYLVQAKATAFLEDGATGGETVCGLVPATAPASAIDDATVAVGAASRYGTLALEGPLSLRADGAVALECWTTAPDATGVALITPRLDAIRVAGIVEQPSP